MLYTSFITPIRIAFIENTDITWIFFELLVDLLFAIDLVFTFISAYYNDEGHLITDKR